MSTLRSVHCGGPGGLAAHKTAGEPPCSFCARAAGLPDPAAAATEPPPGHRYYDVDGVVIGTDSPSAALQALLDTGEATELTGWGG